MYKMNSYDIKRDEPKQSVVVGQYWPDVLERLNQKYQVVYYCDLLFDRLDREVNELYRQLSPFGGRVFSPNERIVISHRDTDYYASPNEFGFTLWNLHRMYANLDIPTEYTMVLTNQPTLQNELDLVASQFNLPPMQAVYCPYVWCPGIPDLTPVAVNIDRIKHPFVSLNGKAKTYRMYSLCQMRERDILDKGMVSLWVDNNQTALNISEPNYSNQQSIPDGLHLRTTYPYTRINDEIILSDDQRKLFYQYEKDLHRPMSHPDILGVAGQFDTRFQPQFLQRALWNIVNETVGEYPHPFVTEKTYKAILTKRPFVMFGAPGTLKAIQDLGFVTFDGWINERYDSLSTIANRIDCVLRQIEEFCRMTPQQLQDVARDMEQVLEYNFNHYIETFGKTDLCNFLDNVL